jgi:hypothetical protein
MLGKSAKGHGYYKIKNEYVAEPGIEEERYIGYYQPGGHFFEPTGIFLNISGPIHGYKTLREAQTACAAYIEVPIERSLHDGGTSQNRMGGNAAGDRRVGR